MKTGILLKRLLAAYTVLIVMLFCAQFIGIYRDAWRPEALNDYGMPSEQVYTPEKLSGRMKNVLAFSAGYPVLWLATFALERKQPKAGERAGRSAEYTLKRLTDRAGEIPEAAVREQVLRKRAGWGLSAVLVVCAVFACLYLFDRNNFSSWELEPVMGGMLLNVFPWVLAGTAAVAVYNVFAEKSMIREIEILKAASKVGEANAVRREKRPTEAVSYILLAAAVLLIVLGAARGDVRSVLAKAIRICTECIGLG